MSVKVILADDHAMVRQSLCNSLQQESNIEIVAQAQDGHSTFELVGQLLPDVVVMDISMPDMNGMEATYKIKKEYPRVKVIALSMHSGSKYVREMFKAGASGYLLKNSSYEELIEAIHTVMSGKSFISPSIGETIVQGFSEKCRVAPSVFSVLTPREREVLQLLAEGKTTKQIALQLNISPKTVEVHRTKIMERLNIDNIATLTKYAIQEGLTLPEL